jgi:formiminotetrahydrofolate cyclodeaminase
MKLIDLTVKDFIEEVSSNSPAPGGGSVAALASSLGIALSNMVGKLSITKKKFKALDIEVQNQFISTINELELSRKELTNFIDKDTEAFNLIMDAFKYPKETIEEKEFRSMKIQEATLIATLVPLEVTEFCLESLKKIETILPYANRNTTSDLGVSILMIHAGFEGAIMNVLINIGGLKDEIKRNEINEKCKQSLTECRILKDNLLEKIYIKL